MLGVGTAVLFYLIGSIPFSYLIARIFKGIDIRQHGSGNVGATNVGRLCGWPYYSLALALDLSKGVISTFLAIAWGMPLILAGLAVIGHNWSIFLKFSGGKGVATSLGILAAISWKACLLTLVVWGVIIITTKYVSVGSMTSLILSPAVLYLFKGENSAIILMSALAALSVYQHRENIGRLLSGQESRAFGKDKEDE